MPNSLAKFDLDLQRGEIGEQIAKKLLTGGTTVEIKTDYHTSSGYIVVEFECRGKPSGIEVTTAEWWCIVFAQDGWDSQIAFFIKTVRLKELYRYYKSLDKVVSGGDGGVSRMVKIPVTALLEPIL